MKHDLPAFLVNEKKEPKCARFYCVAIAAGVATVAGTAYSLYSSQKQQADAKKAAEAGTDAEKYGSRVELPDYESHVNMPGFDAAGGARDMLGMTPWVNATANRMNRGGIRQRELVMPGLQGIMQQAGINLTAMGRGQVNEDAVNNTNQIIAERTGGTYDPSNPSAAGGGRAYSVANFTTGIGRLSQENIDKSLAAGPAWANLASSFAYTPEKAAKSAMDLLGLKYNYALGQAKVQGDIDESYYNSQVNQARAAAGADPQIVGARNDALAMQALNGQANQSQIKAGTDSLQGLIGMFAKTGTSTPATSAGYSNIQGSKMYTWNPASYKAKA
jgi:hypothetical protein